MIFALLFIRFAQMISFTPVIFVTVIPAKQPRTEWIHFQKSSKFSRNAFRKVLSADHDCYFKWARLLMLLDQIVHIFKLSRWLWLKPQQNHWYWLCLEAVLTGHNLQICIFYPFMSINWNIKAPILTLLRNI